MKTGFRLSLLLIVALAAVGTAAAKKMYKYQDENGRWVFTDRRPDHVEEVETRQLKISGSSSKVRVQQRGPRTEPVLYIVNGYYGPVEVQIELVDGQNVTTEPPLPARFVVPASGELRAVSLGPRSPGRGWGYRYGYRVIPGEPDSRPRSDYPYQLPVPTGRPFTISQSFFGRYSHTDPQSQYAVDIVMPEGTPVHAARDGVVMEVANDFFTGGQDAKYLDRANVIRILHDDGTMAVYAHLQLETAQVSPGAWVRTGQHIANAGNTGFSSGPHLHFAIQKNDGLSLVSIPFVFDDGQGQPITPKAGMQLGRTP